MSVYILNDKEISVLVEGIINYSVNASAFSKHNSIMIDLNVLRKDIGQALLNQNYESYNNRYSEDNKPREFQFDRKAISYNNGQLLGCIDCYEYQCGESEEYYSSVIHQTMNQLKYNMLKRYIQKEGYEIEWGLYD